LDESWFYLTTDHEWIWLSEATETAERERITVQGRKIMTTIVRNPTGFYWIVGLPEEMKFNANYYVSHILDPLAEWRRSQVGGSDRSLHVHADNARPHTANQVTEFLAGNDMKRAPHRPYSPDMAPCDFQLFGYIKGTLAGTSFEEPDQLLQVTDAIFSLLKNPRWNVYFRAGRTYWRNVVWQLVVSSKLHKKV
jgi:histone-lysine N-methyltransferase SETMAR